MSESILCPQSGRQVTDESITLRGFANTPLRARCPDCGTEVRVRLTGVYGSHEG